jgi:hypothetical protein
VEEEKETYSFIKACSFLYFEVGLHHQEATFCWHGEMAFCRSKLAAKQ